MEAAFETITNQLADLNARLAEETLQRQNLAQQLEAESNRRQQAEARLAQLEGNGTTQPVMVQPTVTQPVPEEVRPKAPKVATPDKYEGDRGMKAEVFASQVGLYMMCNSTMFTSEKSKVAFALSYLTGAASRWAQPLVKRTLAINPENPVTFDEFIAAFELQFFDPERKAKAQSAIRVHFQRGTVASYTTKFNELAAETGWEESTLISHYRNGLKGEIKAYMVRDEFTKLAEITKIASKIDSELHGIRGSPYSHQSTDQAEGSSRAPDPDAMDLSPFAISREEYARRRAAGLCYKCGGRGHLAAKCKGRGKNGQSKAKISEVEGEDKEEKKETKSAADESKNGDPRDC